LATQTLIQIEDDTHLLLDTHGLCPDAQL
jgi:hypothetical protein